MKRLPSLVLILSILFIISDIDSPLFAQNQALFQGSFVYAPEKSDDIEQAIKNATEKMNFVVRAIARDRLTKTNQPYGRITIDCNPSFISITTDARAPIRTSPDGTPIKWKREDGEVMDVSTRWEDGVLKQTFAAEDGKRINAYAVSGDGQSMQLLVTVSSEKLKEPVRYKLQYRRSVQ